jgi:hypothetical protein
MDGLRRGMTLQLVMHGGPRRDKSSEYSTERVHLRQYLFLSDRILLCVDTDI